MIDLFDFVLEVLKVFLILIAVLFSIVCAIAAVIGFFELLKGHFVWYLIPSTLVMCACVVLISDDCCD